MEPYRSVSIIGMAKNTGKTTTLNYILDEARGIYSLGLTSIGRDGEELDRVTATEKPKIYIKEGTVVATAKNALMGSDFTREIVGITDYTTPMGKVVFSRALSDGFVDLAGPSIGKYVKGVVDVLFSLKCEKVIVDGALGRKSFASPSITDGTILATGAALNSSMRKVVDETIYTAELLSLKEESHVSLSNIIQKDNSRVIIVDSDFKHVGLDVATSMVAGNEIIKCLDDNTRYIVIRGVLTDKVLEMIMKSRRNMKNIIFVVEDGTKVFVKEDNYRKLIKVGGCIKVMNRINLIGITVNPTSPYGYDFPKDEFLQELKSRTETSVFNIVRG